MREVCDGPVAIIWGDEDPYCPWSTAVDLHERIEGSTLTRLTGADHFSPEERPEEVRAVLRVLLR